MLRRWIALSPCLCLAFACGDTEPSGAGDEDSAEQGEAESGENEDEGEEGDAENEEGDEDADSPASVYAHDIKIRRIEVNQGVAIAIFGEGEEIGPADRTAPLIEGRISLVRAEWEIDPERFEAREIEGRLTLRRIDGSTEVLSDTKLVDKESDARTFQTTFNWGLLPEQMEPYSAYRVEFFEVESDNLDDEPPDEPPAFPEKGWAELGVQSGPMHINLLLFPIDTGEGAPVIDEEDEARIEELIMMFNPIQETKVTGMDVIVRDPFESVNQGWRLLDDLRDEFRPSPSTYMQILIDSSSCCTEPWDFSGIGHIGGEADAYARASITKIYGTHASGDRGTIVHELGHNQGRFHSPCGGAAGPDTSYPHENAIIGAQGFDIFDLELVHPSVHYDYMSYCGPTWVSDYTWLRVSERIRPLTARDFRPAPAPGAPGNVTVLRGGIDENGRADWWTIERPPTQRESAHRRGQAVLQRRGSPVASVEVDEIPLSHGHGHFYEAILPDGVPHDSFELRLDGVAPRSFLAPPSAR